MAQAYNFETHELVPYRNDWNRGGNVNVSGALWYIKEKDGIFLIDNNQTEGQNLPKKPDYCMAKGLPAALLAQGNNLISLDFDFRACYQAYYKIAQELFPPKPAYTVHIVLDDWEYTLLKSLPFVDNQSGYIDHLALMTVGCFIREISNFYRATDLKIQLNHNYYLTCKFGTKEVPQLLFSQMPSVADRTEAPNIYARDINKGFETSKLQVNGFMAAIINIALFYFWQNRWMEEYNFTDLSLIRRINSFYRKESPSIEIVNLENLSFDLPIEVEELCKAYMDTFMPIMQKVWKLKPTVQLECREGDNIYTYIYAHEASSQELMLNSELYANLTFEQKRNIISYNRRFMEWMVKTYPITPSSQFRVMQAMGKDMPPIQLQINTQVTHTHAAEPKRNETKKATKLKFILSDDKQEIVQIHKRIELYLSSPAKLRDELARLQEEGFISLPTDNPTEIIRAVREVWGERAPKERSFVTTWGRRF